MPPTRTTLARRVSIARAGALALLLLELACSHRGDDTPAEPTAATSRRASGAKEGDAKVGGAKERGAKERGAKEDAPTREPDDAPLDDDCEQAREGQPCRASHQHCPLSCDDACQPCSLLICTDGAWSLIEEFPEPGCDE
ncbi:MAG: hypothetical protein H6713_26200 [Myxococcales bacterium]|nr:hypothetical protein [Myxococcales bacterium]